MIKIAYTVVICVGLLVAYGLFVLVGSGGDLPDVTETSVAPSDVVAEVVPDAPITGPPLSILDDTTLTSDQSVALMLFGAGPSGETLIVTDAEDLTAARDTLTVPTDRVEERTNAVSDTMFSAFYRDDQLEWVLTCAEASCPVSGIPASAFNATILDAAFSDHSEYSRFVASLPEDPFLQLLDLRPDTDLPEPERAATMALSLPTIVRPAAQPLDVETHGAVLTALLTDLLPEGASVQSVDLSIGAPAQLIDRDSSRPVTANGVPVTLSAYLFYSTDITITGLADLSDDTLSQISDQTRLQADWETDATALIASLDLPCADCYTITPPIPFEDTAAITSQTIPTYLVRYYDLREAP